jgi:hypothetical protein
VPVLRFAHRAQLPALRALLADRRALPHDAATTDAALYHRLEGYAVRADPSSPLREVHRHSIMGAALVRAQLRDAAPVVAAAAGAPPVLVKGPAASALHDAADLRPFGDLDLVVTKAALRPAAAALQTAGWELGRAPRMGVEGGEPWRGFAEAHGHELGLIRRIGARAASLELHWRLADDPRADALDRDALARHGSELDGAIVPRAPELLLALALHLVAHPDRRLLMVKDVQLAAAASGGDLRRAFELAGELGLAWELHLALDAVHDQLGVAVERFGSRPAKPSLGPLRTALWPGPRPLGVHVGRLAALRGSERLRYIGAGFRTLRPHR